MQILCVFYSLTLVKRKHTCLAYVSTKRTCKQSWSTIPPISAKRTITYYLKQVNTEKTMTCDNETPDPVLGQAEMFCHMVNGIPTLLRLILVSLNKQILGTGKNVLLKLVNPLDIWISNKKKTWIDSHSRPHTITKMNDNLNIDNIKSLNTCS